MNVLVLGPDKTNLTEFFRSGGDEVRRTEEPLDSTHELIEWADFIVSFGYRHIIDAATINRIRDRSVNVHISLLPWNRGADPNVWSFLEDTPKGVTIHKLDEGVDTGDILLQEELLVGAPHTLRSSYETLISRADALLRENWDRIRVSGLTARRQDSGGSIHRSADLDGFRHLLTRGWDTPVEHLIGAAAASRDEGLTP